MYDQITFIAQIGCVVDVGVRKLGPNTLHDQYVVVPRMSRIARYAPQFGRSQVGPSARYILSPCAKWFRHTRPAYSRTNRPRCNSCTGWRGPNTARNCKVCASDSAQAICNCRHNQFLRLCTQWRVHTRSSSSDRDP